ncbi:adenosylcobinamide-phosphate synthase CbiB [Xylophilus sp. GOD-11R]|nr:adenosylcobinamide-phosphate synthase CbiB [Xylophilus sp. GOD-11R]WPB58560.1 adenosylcobinamide-phosphate synthase CbiB [Xylophilus sp. GOD-11R]
MPPALAAQAVLVALLVDIVSGEPRRWHPVAGMGRFLGRAGRWAAPERAPTGRDLKAFRRGAMAWVAGAAACAIAAWALQSLLVTLPGWACALLLGLALKPMLAWRMLRDETVAVEAALAQSLPAGRQRLSRLVSRDTTALSAGEVRESAIESLAENFNDSVIAPLFWFALFGLPGAVVYRFANTADAMWGYRGMRQGRCWEWAGKFAARADDALSWLPARLSAAAMLVGAPAGMWRGLPAQARVTPSPNGGWPMGAMALRLGVRLGKPGHYLLNPAGRVPGPDDTTRAVRIATRIVLAMGVLAAFVLLTYRASP